MKLTVASTLQCTIVKPGMHGPVARAHLVS